MTDRITLRGMRFLGRHGVELEERLEPQPFEVDVVLRGDLAAPAASDDLADTVDYSAVFTTVQAIVERQSFRLIEALAGTIADALLADARIGDVEVRVRKPKAPLPGAFDTVEVTLRRTATEADAGSA
ncbi:MAG TPA: dihydroneopterin aldolase [Candidatus Limnocylindria bacterium]|jgi:dihydroneopterin aldolase|nr:dihydroneopterin aldolase [Candidatus Limnocylindria bacterium]